MALTLKSMKSAGAKVTLNPDQFVREINENVDPNSFLSEMSDTVHHEQWKRVTLEDGKKRTKIVGTNITLNDFTKKFLEQTCDFKEHVYKVKEQYKAMKTLKDNLPDGHVAAQMDFAENFSCTAADEVQSAYFNSNSVTLHPVVIYFRNNAKLEHRSFMFVSDDLGHNIGTVYAIMQKLVPEIKSVISHSLEKIHYWTDSPSSQYRNKTAFYLVSCV